MIDFDDFRRDKIFLENDVSDKITKFVSKYGLCPHAIRFDVLDVSTIHKKEYLVSVKVEVLL